MIIRAERFKRRRLELGLTQDQVSNKLGICRTYVQLHEREDRDVKQIKAEKISNVLRCSLKYLTGDEEDEGMGVKLDSNKVVRGDNIQADLVMSKCSELLCSLESPLIGSYLTAIDIVNTYYSAYLKLVGMDEEMGIKLDERKEEFRLKKTNYRMIKDLMELGLF